jgi:Periplasmic binding protein
VPLVNLLPPAPEADIGAAHVFYLLSGPRQEAVCLLRFAHERLSPKTGLAVLSGPRPLERGIAEDLSLLAEKSGFAPPRAIAPPASADEALGLALALSKKGIGMVLALEAGAALKSLLEAAIETGWAPDLLVPGSLGGAGLTKLPGSYSGRLFAAYPMLPADWQASGLEALAALPGQTGVQPERIVSQIAGYAAGALLTEGLRRAGKGLERASFVAALETLYRFETGITPPLTFGPNRRIGAQGAYVVEIAPSDSAMTRAGPWCEAPP